MVQYYNNAIESDDEKESKEKPKKIKYDCKKCLNERSCECCKMKRVNAINKLDTVSLSLLNNIESKWLQRDDKIAYLQELTNLIHKVSNGL
jgi:hypothetical protein